MSEQWVFDSSPLITLGKAGELGWVPDLGEVWIPQAVADEISVGDVNDPARCWMLRKGVKLVQASPAAPAMLAELRLGAGETAVLALAQIRPCGVAVLDDAAARRAAAFVGVSVRGTFSLVVLAKRRGYLSRCGPVFQRLREAGLFVADALIKQALIAAGE